MTTSSVNTVYLEEFLDLARTGAPEAGPYLVSLCGARLANYVNLLAPDLSTADRDVICEKSIERAVRNIGSYDRARSSFDTWVRGFARFVCREYRRQNPAIAFDPADLPEPSVDREEPQDFDAPERPELERVRQALTQLSDADQLIIRLRHYEQLPYESIARMLRVQPAACRQRHARALSRLRNSMGSLNDAGPTVQNPAPATQADDVKASTMEERTHD